jgi:hypothetical protein
MVPGVRPAPLEWYSPKAATAKATGTALAESQVMSTGTCAHCEQFAVSDYDETRRTLAARSAEAVVYCWKVAWSLLYNP